MGERGVAAALVALGLGLTVVSVLADPMGLGGGSYVFGWEQKLGVVVGWAVAWFAGLWLCGWRPGWSSRRRRLTTWRHSRSVSTT
jgi:hypothetical protein